MKNRTVKLTQPYFRNYTLLAVLCGFISGTGATFALLYGWLLFVVQGGAA